MKPQKLKFIGPKDGLIKAIIDPDKSPTVMYMMIPVNEFEMRESKAESKHMPYYCAVLMDKGEVYISKYARCKNPTAVMVKPSKKYMKSLLKIRS